MIARNLILMGIIVIFICLSSLLSCWNTPILPPEEDITVPEAPTLLRADPENKEVALEWSSPSGGITTVAATAVSQYRVYYSTTAVDTASASIKTVKHSGKRILRVSGLTYGTVYNFAVAAINLIGESDLSNSMSATPLFLPDRVPGAPINVQVTPGGFSVRVAWSAPADTGREGGNGSPGVITEYKVHYGTGGNLSSVVSVFNFSGSVDFQKRIWFLDNGTSYSFAVTAVNGSGESPLPAAGIPGTPNLPSSPTNSTPPGQSSDPVATPGLKQITLSWTPPVDRGTVNGKAGTITGYMIYYSSNLTNMSPDKAQSSYVSAGRLQSLGLQSPRETIKGLTSSSEYWFAVVAFNEFGEGNAMFFHQLDSKGHPDSNSGIRPQ